jgi:hypothetical protein
MRLDRMVIAALAAVLVAACSDVNAPTVPDPLGSVAHGDHDRDHDRSGFASISGMKCLVTAGRREHDGDGDDDYHISRSGGWDGWKDEHGHRRDYGRRDPCVRGYGHGTGIADWPISLAGTDYEGTPVSLSAVTDARGKYAFPGLRRGRYTVCEGTKAGFEQVFPRAGASCPGGTFGYEIVLRSAQGVTNADFGNRVAEAQPTLTGRIEGAVLIDGTPDGMSNWAVFLFDGNGAAVAQTITIADGSYAFADLPAGMYMVCQDLPVWMRLDQQSAPLTGDPGTGQCASNGTVGYIITITGAGEVMTGKNFSDNIAG